MKLSSEDLRTFLALAEEKSFTRAAARCNKSQSAFSSRIRVLEEMLGARLFDRTTRSVELTVEGKIFAESARQLFSEFTDMVDNFRDYAARRKGRVSIAALPSVSSAWLPMIFRRFRQANPGIELALTDTISERCLDLVRSGGVDIAITSATLGEDDLDSVMLAREGFFLVHPRDHPLAVLDKVDIGDLVDHDFVHLITNSSVRAQVDAALHPRTVRTTLELRYLETVATMVAAGMGITLVPGLTLHHFRDRDLVIRPIATDFVRPIHLVRRRGRQFSVAAEAMHRFLLHHRPTFARLLETGRTEMPAPQDA